MLKLYKNEYLLCFQGHVPAVDSVSVQPRDPRRGHRPAAGHPSRTHVLLPHVQVPPGKTPTPLSTVYYVYFRSG